MPYPEFQVGLPVVYNRPQPETVARQWLSIRSQELAGRSNLDNETRRFDLNKLGLSALYHVLADSDDHAEDIVIFSQESTANIQGLIGHFKSLGIETNYYSDVHGLGNLLANRSGSFCLLTLGGARPRPNDLLTDLAKMLGRCEAGALRAGLLSFVETSYAPKSDNYQERIGSGCVLIQERPGKLGLLSSARQNLRSNQRTWQNIALARGGDIAPTLATFDGWSFFCARFIASNQAADHTGKAAQVVYSHLDFEDQIGQFNFGKVLIERLNDWLTKDVGIALGALVRIELLTPYVAIAVACAEAFKISRSPEGSIPFVTYESALLGWSPTATILDMVAHQSGPAVVIDFSDFPRIAFMAILR